MTKYNLTNEEFFDYLAIIVGRMTPAQILSYGEVYNVLAEELNNEVLDAWYADHKSELIAKATSEGEKAGECDATHDCETPNPYGMDTESDLWEAWDAAYEDSFYETAK